MSRRRNLQGGEVGAPASDGRVHRRTLSHAVALGRRLGNASISNRLNRRRVFLSSGTVSGKSGTHDPAPGLPPAEGTALSAGVADRRERAFWLPYVNASS